MHAPPTTCGRCGSPTRTQVVKGLNVQSCVSCGCVTLDQLTLERLLGGPSSHWGATPPGAGPYAGAPTVANPHATPPILGHLPPPGGAPPPPPNLYSATPMQAPPPRMSSTAPTRQLQRPTPAMAQPPPQAQRSATPPPANHLDEFDIMLAQRAATRQRRTTMALTAVFLILVSIGGVGLSYLVLDQIMGKDQHSVPQMDLEQILEPDPEPETTPEAAPDPAPDAQPEPEPEPEPAPEPEPTAAAAPAPAPQPTGIQGLLNQGWNIVGSDPYRAADLFRSVLGQSPSHAEGNYGLGYALLQQNNPAAAQPHLCAALNGPDIEIRRDVTSLLSKHSLSCN